MRFHLLNKVKGIRSDREDLVTLCVKMQQDHAYSVLPQGTAERRMPFVSF